MFDGIRNARQGADMEDAIDPDEVRLDLFKLSKIRQYELGARIDPFALARRQIIQHPDAMPRSDQRVDQIRTDEPGAARNEIVCHTGYDFLGEPISHCGSN